MNSSAEMRSTVARITGRGRGVQWRRWLGNGKDIRELIADAKERWWGSADAARRTNRRLLIGVPVVVLVVGAGLWLWLGPMFKPDYEKARLDRVFRYTLLTDEFNKLPVEERMKLIGQLVQRLSSMSAGESSMMAAFAAGIAGAAREQIEENASRLAVDMWDKYALQYKDVKPEDRGAYLDRAAIEFVRTMEAIGGRPSTKSDTEILNDMKRQAKRDSDNLKNAERRPPGQALGRMFSIMNGNVGGHATPAQRGRGQLLMRDMVERMRGGG